MTSKRWLYALPGLLCLLGLIGIYSEEKGFLTFFAFAIHFQYLFMPNDEMVEQSMTLSAARAFYCGMVTTSIASLFCFFLLGHPGNKALSIGFACGWSASVVVHSLSTAYFAFKETWGLDDDQKSDQRVSG